MKNIVLKNRKGNNLLARIAFTAMAVIAAVFGMSAQNSLPAPGTGGSFNPAPIGGGNPGWGGGPGWGGPGPGWGGPGPGWNNGWGPGWGYSPSIIINTPSYVNRGTVNVAACGYDAQGIWRTIPMHVAYYYNGVDYDVTVINAWNPWTQSWMRNIDQPAYNTDYYLRGNTYDFYAPLSIGTFYFNL